MVNWFKTIVNNMANTLALPKIWIIFSNVLQMQLFENERNCEMIVKSNL